MRTTKHLLIGLISVVFVGGMVGLVQPFPGQAEFLKVKSFPPSARHPHKPPPAFTQVEPKKGIAIEQLGFELSGGFYPHTDWGRLVIDPKKVKSTYLNIIICAPTTTDASAVGIPERCAWQVQNLFVPTQNIKHKGKGLLTRILEVVRLLRTEPAILKDRAFWHQFFRNEMARRFQLTLPIDLYPNSTLEERVVRVSLTTVVNALQGLVLSSAKVIPNQQVFRQVIRENKFKLTTFPVGQAMFDAAGGDGEQNTITTTTSITTDAAAAPPANYLDAIGPPPMIPDPFPIPGNEPLVVLPTETMQMTGFNIQCMHNQCAECADVNAYRFLTATTPFWSLGFPMMPGYAEDPDPGEDPEAPDFEPTKPDFTLYGPIRTFYGAECANCTAPGIMDAFARRENVTGPDSGDGTDRCEHYRALFGYLQNLEMNGVLGTPVTDFVHFRHAGTTRTYGDGARCDDADDANGVSVIPDGLQSTSSANDVTWQWIFDELSAERALVCSIGRYSFLQDPHPKRIRTSGHVVRVHGARSIQVDNNRQEWVYFLHDARQGLANGDVSAGLDTGIWKLEHLNDNDFLNVNGTTTELEFCISIKAISDFPDPGETF